MEDVIITKTPLRISFTGGGTDLPAYYKQGYGAVVSAAINKYVYITMNKRFDDTIRISYSKTEIVDSLKEIQHDIAKACMQMAGVEKGVEITSISDIPAGTGLGSSSSFTVGLLNALYSYCGERLSAYELAEKACQIEIDILGHPIGKQDQYAASFGGINYFTFERNGDVNREKIDVSEDDKRLMDSKLMMFYTGISRSADGILAKQSAETSEKLDVLNERGEFTGIIETREECHKKGLWHRCVYLLLYRICLGGLWDIHHILTALVAKLVFLWILLTAIRTIFHFLPAP